jgi:transposase
MVNLAKFGYEVLHYLLPEPKKLQVESWYFDEATPGITLTVSSKKTLANCPLCNELTSKVHSRYQRTLTDLPWANYNITLQLKVRKFFCINSQCRRRIFTERLASITTPRARNCTTVFRYLRTSTFPERRGRSDCGRSLLDPYKNYILQKWNDGCHDTKRLYEEIQQHGYSGSYSNRQGG